MRPVLQRLCGASLFKMSPAEFEDFPADKQADLKETWCGVPVLSGAMLMFDDNGDHAKIFLSVADIRRVLQSRIES